MFILVIKNEILPLYSQRKPDSYNTLHIILLLVTKQIVLQTSDPIF